MNQTDILLRILLAVVLGAILGLETETRDIEIKGADRKTKEEKAKLGGVRTYSVLALLGALAGIFYFSGNLVLVYMLFAAVIGLVVAAYVLNVQVKQAFGLTTELAVILTFLIGFLTTSNLVELALVLVILILLTFFLSQKNAFQPVVLNIRHGELIDIVKFGLTAIVILPILPNQTYTIGDLIKLLNLNLGMIASDLQRVEVINPFRIWLIVVLIIGISLGGYIASRFIGKRGGIFLTAFVGGFISSTATTISLAQKAKTTFKNDRLNRLYAGGALVSNASSFITFLLLLTASSLNLLRELGPAVLLMFVIGNLVGIGLIISAGKDESSEIEFNYSRFSLLPALKFVGLIVALTLLIQLVKLNGNSEGVLAVTALSGILGMDPAIIATSGLVESTNLTLQVGVMILILTNAVNFIAKSIYGLIYGQRRFATYLAIGLMITAVGSLIALFS
jgi:uncharacterized membrane protein (DUF4010 family)